MPEREAYIEKAKARIDHWNADIEKLQAKVDAAEANAKIKQIAGSGDEAWDDMKAGFDRAWDRISDALDSAMSRFSKLCRDDNSGTPSRASKRCSILCHPSPRWRRTTPP
ncbi:MAG: hypothetical protein ACQEVT_09110 [Pseudomonadota bacterium]|uniref:hypothetical protein n=1 Tax=Roseovarius TaxID=74030 RepID=UPI0022A8C400|nr:hypothetical protein [Roseovarius sp. EGI FJ00037]MCZ0813045.1 hypothetical protein [Roseovarius sp. EGI FJ00037]